MARSNRWVAEPPKRSTPKPPPSAISDAVAQLQADWHALTFMDRAERVDVLLKARLSCRYVASLLNCSEALLRNYAIALQASPKDIHLARLGRIGLREIVRRARSGVQQPDPIIEPGEDCYNVAALDAQQGAAMILHWLKTEPARAYYAYAIIQQAIAVLDRPGSTARLRAVHLRPDPGVDELIEACRPEPTSEASNGSGPADTVDQLLSEISYYGFWLANYVFSLMVEPNVRREALNRALRQVPAPGRKPKLW